MTTSSLRRVPASRASRIQPIDKISKAKTSDPQEPPFPLLKSVIVHCLCDIPDRDCSVIYAGTEAFGGEYRDILEDSVTHIVTLGECSEYGKGLNKWLEKGIKVILPEWFDDCFQLSLLPPDDQYLFPDPKVLTMELADLLSSKVFPPRKEEKKAPTNTGLLAGKVFFIHQSSLSVSSSGVSIAEGGSSLESSKTPKFIDAIESVGGKVTNSLEECTTVLIETQCNLFEEAKLMNKEIGTRRWIRDLLKAQKLISPLDAVLYFPYPSYHLPEMKNIVLSVSNYVGPAREDIFAMATRLGASATRSMTMSNTHLITACAGGEKFTKAHSWNMHIVNHLWLEEIYCKWSYQREAKPKYVFFPHCLGKMVNKVRVIQRQSPVSSHLQGKIDDGSSIADTHGVKSSGVMGGLSSSRRLSKLDVLQDMQRQQQDEKSQKQPPSISQMHEKAEIDAVDAVDVINLEDVVADGGTDGKRVLEKNEQMEKYEKTANQEDELPQPVGTNGNGEEVVEELVAFVEGEVEIPGVSVEVQRPADADFNMEPPIPEDIDFALLSGGPSENVVELGQLIADELEVSIFGPPKEVEDGEIEEKRKLPQPIVTKRYETVLQDLSLQEASVAKDLQVGEQQEPKEKKRSFSTISLTTSTASSSKKAKPEATKMNVLFTGIRPVELQKKAMKNLGVAIVNSVAEASLLITCKIARTEKFLQAVAKGIPIVDLKWVEELSSRKQIPNPLQYSLVDEEGEKLYSFQLKKALSNANKRKIFEGCSIYCLGRVEPDIKTVKRLVEVGGGNFMGMVTKNNLSAYLTEVESQSFSDQGDLKTFCFCSETDSNLVSQLQIRNAFSTEMLLTGMLKQELEWSKYLIHPF